MARKKKTKLEELFEEMEMDDIYNDDEITIESTFLEDIIYFFNEEEFKKGLEDVQFNDVILEIMELYFVSEADNNGDGVDKDNNDKPLGAWNYAIAVRNEREERNSKYQF